MCVMQVSGQTYSYSPLNDSTLVWYTDNDIYPMGFHNHWQDSYFFTGVDTVIESSTYQIVYDPTGSAREHYIRMDTNERYYLSSYPGDGNFPFAKDILLYDFGARVGDTLYISPGDTLYHNDTLYYYVRSIDTILVNNSLRKRFTVTNNLYLMPGSSQTCQWIEGVGNATWGLLSFFTHDIGFGFSFCGLAKNGAMIYPSYVTTLCNTPSGVNELYNDAISVYPNPASDYLIVRSEGVSPTVSYRLYDMTGQPLISDTLSGNQIPLRNISSGVYVLLISEQTGKVSKLKIVKE
jgi:hypothetical protein